MKNRGAHLQMLTYECFRKIHAPEWTKLCPKTDRVKPIYPPPQTLFVGDIKINSSIEHLCNHNPQITFVFHAYFYLFAKYLKFPVEFHIVTSSGQNREILLLSSRFAFLIRLGFTARSC